MNKYILSILLHCLPLSSHEYHEEKNQLDPTREIFSNRQFFPLNQQAKIEGVSPNTIYLSFDDGPSKSATPLVLDALEDYKAKATFFVVGERIKSHRKIIERTFAEGHIISNHTFYHELNFQNEKEFYNSLLMAHWAIIPYKRNGDTLLFRAPGGVWNSWRANLGNAHQILKTYVGPIYWNAGGGRRGFRDDADWKCWKYKISISRCATSYVQQIKNNYHNNTASLVLFHDINLKSGKLIREVLKKLEEDSINWRFELIETIPTVQRLNHSLTEASKE